MLFGLPYIGQIRKTDLSYQLDCPGDQQTQRRVSNSGIKFEENFQTSFIRIDFSVKNNIVSKITQIYNSKYIYICSTWGVFYTYVSKSGYIMFHIHVHWLNIFILTNVFRQDFSFQPIYNNLDDVIELASYDYIVYNMYMYVYILQVQHVDWISERVLGLGSHYQISRSSTFI